MCLRTVVSDPLSRRFTARRDARMWYQTQPQGGGDRELLLWYHNLNCPNSTFIAAENGWGLFVLDSAGITVVRVELALGALARSQS